MHFLNKTEKGRLVKQQIPKRWLRVITMVVLCTTVVATEMMRGGVLANNTFINSATISNEESKETKKLSEGVEDKTTYTLYLTHYFRFKVNGKGRYVSAEEKIELNKEDFKDGKCDLSRFAYDVKQLMVTEAKPLSIEDFDENREGGARIVYNVNSGWKIVPQKEAQGEGTVLREVFSGGLTDYKFVPANIIRIKLDYKYSNTGAMAGIDVKSPEIIEVIPKKQSDGLYHIEYNLPTVEGFRIVLNPEPLNTYLVNPPKGTETPEELETALERGDFDLDAEHNKIYYYQEKSGENIHPIYQNQYSTVYNEAWDTARCIETDEYIAMAKGYAKNGANPLQDPQLSIALKEEQLKNVLENDTKIALTVYYRRNATWYMVNHWVPKTLSGLTDYTGMETKIKDGVDYVLLDQETLHGRVGTMTKANAKTDDVYEKLTPIGYSQKLIENAATASMMDTNATTVDVYYKAAEFYRVIFDTNYTYIPRQQIKLGGNVDLKVNEPKRMGYTFDGWQYLKKDAKLVDGEYPEDAYVKVTGTLTIDDDFISKKAMLQDSKGVLALHLYPIWKPATTQVRVVLWTENLTGEDDVQAIASGGNSTYYDMKYQNYQKAPLTHTPKLGETDPNYSNMGSFTLTLDTNSSLVDKSNQKNLITEIQNQVSANFKRVMGQENGIDSDRFYTQADFEIIHDTSSSIDYTTTTASADGKTMIYVYFTRNIYELQFHYYGNASIGGSTSDFCVANKTNGYSYAGADKIFNSDGTLNFGYSASHTNGSASYKNSWLQAQITSAHEMPVPQTITIKAKYGADLRDVWPVSRAEEQVTTNSDGWGNTAKMVSWAVTDGQYRTDAMTPGSSHYDEPTIMGSYATLNSEIIADTENRDKVHHLIAYWGNRKINYYRNNHCLEIPNLNIDSEGVLEISTYNSSKRLTDTLYLVPSRNEAFQRYGFTDLMLVSYENGNIIYNDPNGTYYAVRGYSKEGETKYYAISRQVSTVSSNAINKQNPSARLHMTRANENADHNSQYVNSDGAWSGVQCGTEDEPYDLYFYYNRDRYTITYMAPTSKENATSSEVVLGIIELPYGAQVNQEKYGFALDYKDTNQTTVNGKHKYTWTTSGDAIAVCPDRSVDGSAQWNFKGWALGPGGVNMQWTIQHNQDAQAQVEETFAIEGNLDLYAIWEQPVYKVTFHLNGGIVGKDQSIRFEVPANVRYSVKGSIPRPVREGYTLSGWYLGDENGVLIEPNTAFDFDKPVTADQHVVAVWEAISTKKYNYTIYYVTKELSYEDQTKPLTTVQIDKDAIVTKGGERYYVLEKNYQKDQQFISDAMLNLAAKGKSGYIPLQTNKALALANEKDSYNIIFYYSPIIKAEHKIRFVEAGTENRNNQNIIKEVQESATQIITTPTPATVKELNYMGYELVCKDAKGNYKKVDNYLDLTWIDTQGNTQLVSTLSHGQIPKIITYLVRPITYTITYKNADNAPSMADNALQVITAQKNTSVESANGKNPTQYTVENKFTVKNPAVVYDHGKWYEFSHWSLGKDTIAYQVNDTFDKLTIDQGTTGHLTFVANWKEAEIRTETGQLTISNKVEGIDKGKDRDFSFKVTITNDNNVIVPLNGAFGDLNFINGVATFTLKHDESKTASELLAGFNYKVEEVDANRNGYKTISEKEIGIIKADENITVQFVNSYKDEEIDIKTDSSGSSTGQKTSNDDIIATGDSLNQVTWLSLMGISFIGLIFMIIVSKKQIKE